MTYLLQLSLIWLFGFLFIRFWLRGEKLPKVKRIAILGTLLLGLLIPLLPLSEWIGRLIVGARPTTIATDFANTILLPEVRIGATTGSAAGTSIPAWLAIWLAGALIIFIRLLYGWLQIGKIYKQTSRAKILGRPVRILEGSTIMPFSYGPLLFWPKNVSPNSAEWLPIWHHECAHVDQGTPTICYLSIS
ncbi:MAG: hypothetical protein AAF741_09600 [Bacteroidota bacterium]